MAKAVWVLLVVLACDRGEDKATETKPVASGSAEKLPAEKPPLAVKTGSAVSAGSGSGAMIAGIAIGAASAPDVKIGDRVFGLWTNGRWYPGKIGKVNDNGTFDVHYDDGDVSRGLPPTKIRFIDGTYRVGDAVYGMWTNGRFYPGKIAAINPDGTYRVHYNDGDVSPSLPASKLKPR